MGFHHYDLRHNSLARDEESPYQGVHLHAAFIIYTTELMCLQETIIASQGLETIRQHGGPAEMRHEYMTIKKSTEYIQLKYVQQIFNRKIPQKYSLEDAYMAIIIKVYTM